MAEEDQGEEVTESSPADMLKAIEKKAGISKILMISALAVSGILISVMATGMTVMYLRISALTDAASSGQEDPMEEQFVVLEQQLMLLADFRKSELKKISAYTKQLDKIANDCSLEKAAPYRDFLSSRENDYQTLVTTVQTGMENLAAMSRGSKTWLGSHSKTLEELKDASIERQATFDSLLRRSK